LGLKGNQGAMHDAAIEHFERVDESLLVKFTEVDKDHGRIETREYSADKAMLVPGMEHWLGVNSIIKVVSTREINGKITVENRFYISSLKHIELQKIAGSIRNHWGIENSLHYVLDVTFNQDKCRIRKEHGPENVSIIRKIVLNLVKLAPRPDDSRKIRLTIKRKRLMATWNRSYLETILRGANPEMTRN
jgi:predicted transposase YbfD/YdcC